MSTARTLAPWPYPRWVAHRGAGKLAPENTLAAFRLGASYGYRMFECDVKLSADNVPFLLHDATLDRTSNGSGTAGDLRWEELVQLDAGSWRAPEFTGERLADFDTIARFCVDNGHFLNIEIKPTPGAESATGTRVADRAAELWQGTEVPPLLTSFQIRSLEAARIAQPQLPRGLLIDKFEDVPGGWLATAGRLECVAIVCNYRLWNADTVAQAKAAGFRTLSYTVNDEANAAQLIDWQTDGVITDRVDLFRP